MSLRQRVRGPRFDRPLSGLLQQSPTACECGHHAAPVAGLPAAAEPHGRAGPPTAVTWDNSYSRKRRAAGTSPSA